MTARMGTLQSPQETVGCPSFQVARLAAVLATLHPHPVA